MAGRGNDHKLPRPGPRLQSRPPLATLRWVVLEQAARGEGRAGDERLEFLERNLRIHLADSCKRPKAAVCAGEDALAADDLRKLADADRKSTRLNSSHEWISYAVFCLKK